VLTPRSRSAGIVRDCNWGPVARNEQNS
jgi:hypothetical protein